MILIVFFASQDQQETVYINDECLVFSQTCRMRDLGNLPTLRLLTARILSQYSPMRSVSGPSAHTPTSPSLAPTNSLRPIYS